ncbi:MAG: hypothetical protein JWO80_3729 [Bryobacterales bacterium]|nr:hypothetical protein [Bryobacterales bacterium]
MFELHRGTLLVEIAPGKNRIMYLWGHLAAVHDGMFSVLRLGERLHPELDAVFIAQPMPLPSSAEIAKGGRAFTLSSCDFTALGPNEWLERHGNASAEEFERNATRNRLAVLLNRTNHASYHFGQMMLAEPKDAVSRFRNTTAAEQHDQTLPAGQFEGSTECLARQVDDYSVQTTQGTPVGSRRNKSLEKIVVCRAAGSGKFARSKIADHCIRFLILRSEAALKLLRFWTMQKPVEERQHNIGDYARVQFWLFRFDVCYQQSREFLSFC